MFNALRGRLLKCSGNTYLKYIEPTNFEFQSNHPKCKSVLELKPREIFSLNVTILHRN